MVRERGLEPPPLAGPDPKSGVSAISPLARRNTDKWFEGGIPDAKFGGRLFWKIAKPEFTGPNEAAIPLDSALLQSKSKSRIKRKRMTDFNNPFAGLDSAGLPEGKLPEVAPSQPTKRKSRGRVDILRQTAG